MAAAAKDTVEVQRESSCDQSPSLVYTVLTGSISEVSSDMKPLDGLED